ncbi:MAG: UDP-N-acetylmuramoyl-L-alanyl-D-glutamate--2,6-diaminopimelate ligase [Desulfuromonadaceae bacterium]|nr:UDP-N-acetylmuramoyl-L-alanyl-D-glutamate--2,6-diaminopimelate ligase [Desulfuromonadaceae bacterium]
MRISALLDELRRNGIDLSITDVAGTDRAEIKDLCSDSRMVEPGSVFFAVRGAIADGHNYLQQAVTAGASAVVVEVQPCINLAEINPEICVIRVADVRTAMAYAARAFYSDAHQKPCPKMYVAGVTGTNGKTTLTYMLEALMQACGLTPAVIGTISNRMDGEVIEASHTTPDVLSLYKMVAVFKARGADALALEVSSHALEQKRVIGLDFDLGVFTNLTPEHLDYHPDMEAYYSAKARLFSAESGYGCRKAVINIADPYGVRLAAEVPAALLVDPRPGSASAADVRVVSAEFSLAGVRAKIRTPAATVELHSNLIGAFNLENLCCAMGAGLAMGLSAAEAVACLAQLQPVPGRLERVENTLGALVLVDYAHTPDALEKALEAVVALKPKRLLSVVGCGGDRDKGKRPLMAAAAVNASALALITSDNPRTENPAEIIRHMVAGATNTGATCLSLEQAKAGVSGYCVMQDRAEALKFAVTVLQPGDVLLVTGKGHEDYQIIGTTKFHFDDREHLRAALKERGTAR